MFDIYMFEKANGLKICKTIHNFNPDRKSVCRERVYPCV